MRLLAVESATDLVGAALLGPDGGVTERSHVGGRAHAELLAPAIEEVCAVSGCTVGDIDRIAVDIGPGLFTGLRVGVATAKALAQALGVAVLGVTSLDTLAAATASRFDPGRARPVVAVVDARRGEVFAAAYRFDRAPNTGSGQPVDPESVRSDRLEPLAPDELVAWVEDLAGEAGPVTLVGDGVVRYHQLLGPVPGLDLGWAETLSSPPPLALAHLARQRLDRGVPPVPVVDLVPDYRRQADARINWEQRNPRQSGSAPAATPGGPR
jgi:tRNA threonylcarbamoyladenosine biosynthesis protein TsaB